MYWQNIHSSDDLNAVAPKPNAISPANSYAVSHECIYIYIYIIYAYVI